MDGCNFFFDCQSNPASLKLFFLVQLSIVAQVALKTIIHWAWIGFIPVSVVWNLTSWISCPLLKAFAISFEYHSLNLLFKNDFATPLIAKSNGWNTWVRFSGTYTVTQWFPLIISKTRWVHWALKASKMSMHFCSSLRSNLVWLGKRQKRFIQDARLLYPH